MVVTEPRGITPRFRTKKGFEEIKEFERMKSDYKQVIVSKVKTIHYEPRL